MAGTVHSFVFDGASPYTEFDPAFTRQTGGFYTYANGTTYFNRTDQPGTPRLSTDYTGAVAREEGALMGPYGDNFTETLSTLDFTGFAGGDWDVENNGDHFGAREYENTHGSWLSPDPAGLAVVDISNPQTWNRYAYVLDNPVSYTDPTGLFRVGPLAYAGYYTFGCDDMNGGGLLNNCDFLNPFSGMQGILLSQLTDPMLAEWSGLGPSYLCGGESLGLPCGLPSQGISIWDILGVSPPGANCMPICDAEPASPDQIFQQTLGLGVPSFLQRLETFNQTVLGCYNNFHSTGVGKATEFLSGLSWVPEFNNNWEKNILHSATFGLLKFGVLDAPLEYLWEAGAMGLKAGGVAVFATATGLDGLFFGGCIGAGINAANAPPSNL